jgi:hypothetical protein
MKIRSVGAEWFRADGQTDTHDEASRRFAQFCESDFKNSAFCPHSVFMSFMTLNVTSRYSPTQLSPKSNGRTPCSL